jgi:hypothetical protein
MAISSVDAHMCYDRIAHSIASICFQQWDVDLNPIISMLLMIQKMCFYLQTAYGDSKHFYGGTWESLSKAFAKEMAQTW